eukprot:TRINITY_DN5683_c0_g1_i2.p1 TRINITY_DN5683_c0_g1~~TRINITY_DN5683_c0_g1_i2.p1  ORF type:complete len:294 (-),score=47.43 TRINITY_DN5683_c0_g1_i2:87-968(-)
MMIEFQAFLQKYALMPTKQSSEFQPADESQVNSFATRSQFLTKVNNVGSSNPSKEAQIPSFVPKSMPLPFKVKNSAVEAFVLGGRTLETESKFQEYKNYNFEDANRRMININTILLKHILAFLNGGVGSIYLGIQEVSDGAHKYWEVRGFKVTLVDTVKNDLVNLIKSIIPRNEANKCVELIPHSVYDLKADRPTDLVVLEMKFTRKQDFFAEIFLSPIDYLLYIREDGASIVQGEGVEPVMSHYTNKMIKSKDDLYLVMRYRDMMMETVKQVYNKLKSTAPSSVIQSRHYKY